MFLNAFLLPYVNETVSWGQLFSYWLFDVDPPEWGARQIETEKSIHVTYKLTNVYIYF